MEKDTKGSSNEKRISTKRHIRTLHHSWIRGPRIHNRTLSHNQDIEMEEMKDPMAPTAKEKKTGFYKLFGMSKRQWDQEIKWAQARKNKQRREMKTFKDITDEVEGELDEISTPSSKELDELSTQQQIQRRRNRKNAYLQKTMAKYRAASKAGIHPSKVHQRRNTLTVKKT